MAGGRRLTRRDALSGAATVGAGLLLAPSAAWAASGAQRARLFSRAVGRLTPGRPVLIVSRRPFCLAAAAWAAPAQVHIELRSRRADGRWGPWALASSAGHEGDGVPTRGRVGEGVWTGAAAELQLRTDRTVDGVVVHLVEAEAATVDRFAADAAGPPLVSPILSAGPGPPPIIARRAWAGADHPPVGGPYYGTIQLGIVHHTENPNGYSPAEVPAMLRAIYEFHVHGRGWYDIGYNFIVDRFGRIWEGRQGGIDLPVLGAQAGDWNQISFGVSLLGTYTDVLPSPAALAAVEHLTAWKMALNGLPVTGEVAEVVPDDGVSYTPFRVGEHVRFPRVAGHRDVDSTDCPGGALYGHLPAMRPRIHALTGDPPTLGFGGEITYLSAGPALTLTGRLAAPDGSPVAAAPLTIEEIVGTFGHRRTLAAGLTAADGTFSATIAARAGQLLRAVHADPPAAVSALLSVQPLSDRVPIGVETLRLTRRPGG